MRQYHDLLRLVLETGTRKSDRTGTGTLPFSGIRLGTIWLEGFRS
jgi:thymidylate synthase